METQPKTGMSPTHYAQSLNLSTVPPVLLETQDERDRELAAYLRLEQSEVAAWPTLQEEALRIIGDVAAFYREPLTEARLVALYRGYPDLHFGQHLKTVMHTSVYGRGHELFDLLGLISPGESVLDFGSGVGTHSIMFLQAGCRVDLLDVDGRLRDYALHRLAQRKLQPETLLEHDAVLTAEKYDQVVCTDVLEHMLNPVQTVKRLVAALKPGGVIHVLMSEKHVETWGHIGAAQENWKKNGGQDYLQSELEPLNAYNFRKRIG